MLTISDIIFDYRVGFSIKEAFLELMERESVHSDLQILKPTATNDDVNGSQHASNGGTDFTYEDATIEDVIEGSALGYYEYFANGYAGNYTGHSYEGSGERFAAAVVNPPAYAATVSYSSY